MPWITASPSQHRGAAVIAALVLAAGCTSGNNTGGNGTGNNTMTASVDGVAFNPSTESASYSDAGLSVVGQQTAGATVRQIRLSVFGVTGTGTYDVGQQPLNLATYGETTGYVVTSWSSAFTGGSGTVTVTQLTATRVVGTFSFVAPAVTATGATGIRAVTSGGFNLALP